MLKNKIVFNEKINLFDFNISNYSLHILREDQIHPSVSGNKYRKLLYNLLDAKKKESPTLLTFGGAFSNHIAATAAAGKEANINTIGIIRGEELIDKVSENPTLTFAKDCGMKLHFISRKQYSTKDHPLFLSFLKQKFGDFYYLPEGGTNSLAVKGCSEIITKEHESFDYICTPVGTGGTIAGIIKASHPKTKVIGFSALKGTFQVNEITKYTSKQNFKLLDDYCFGGYAKVTLKLVQFMNIFYKKTGILLDPVYTGKMLFGIFDMIQKEKFKKNTRILAIHTGGQQGIKGMNGKLKKMGLPLINI